MTEFRLFILMMPLGILFCTVHGYSQETKTRAIAEIRQTEKEFVRFAAEKGIAEAFWFFADSSAVIKRANDSLLKGRDRIRAYYSSPEYKTAIVNWSPDFTDASASGDLGYTYGKYSWQFKDNTGQYETFTGIFHTVWKKQKDGKWKFVWD
jgi:ketosteroid isomerase-like protein